MRSPRRNRGQRPQHGGVYSCKELYERKDDFRLTVPETIRYNICRYLTARQAHRDHVALKNERELDLPVNQAIAPAAVRERKVRFKPDKDLFTTESIPNTAKHSYDINATKGGRRYKTARRTRRQRARKTRRKRKSRRSK